MFRFFVTFLIIFIFSMPVSAKGMALKKVVYKKNVAPIVQESIDEELFEDNSSVNNSDIFDENILYTENGNNENNEDLQIDEEYAIYLEKPAKSISKKVLRTGIEANYIYNPVQAENMIWDDSSNFRQMMFLNQNYFDFNESAVLYRYYTFKPIADDDYTRIYLGQMGLSYAHETPVYFIDELESNFDSGATVTTKIDKLTVAVGSYKSSKTQGSSGGISFAGDEFRIKNSNHNLRFGGAAYTNERGLPDSMTSMGVWGQYRYRRFKLGLQAAQASYAYANNNMATMLFIAPEYQLSDKLSLKGKFGKYYGDDLTNKEFAIYYTPNFNNDRNFTLGLIGSFYSGVVNQNKVKLMTSFRL